MPKVLTVIFALQLETAMLAIILYLLVQPGPNAKLSDSVMPIFCMGNHNPITGTPLSMGSCVIVKADGKKRIAVTCKHCVSGMVKFRVGLWMASLVAVSADSDLAILEFEPDRHLECVGVGDNPSPGEAIAQVGYGGIMFKKDHWGWAVKTTSLFCAAQVIDCELGCEKGDSGSPVFRKGKVAGIVSAGTPKDESDASKGKYTVVVPASEIKKLLNKCGQ